MRFVTVTQLSNLGKAAIAMIFTLGALLNIPQVSAVLGQIVKQHPHFAVIAGAFTTFVSLMANPQVQKILRVTDDPTIPPEKP